MTNRNESSSRKKLNSAILCGVMLLAATAAHAQDGLSKPERKTLERVNQQVNRAIRYESDLMHYGRDEWVADPEDGKGDCEDYALTKAKRLREAGFPASRLSIVVGTTERGELHAVLAVKVGSGRVILDNQSQWIEDDRRYQTFDVIEGKGQVE